MENDKHPYKTGFLKFLARLLLALIPILSAVFIYVMGFSSNEYRVKAIFEVRDFLSLQIDFLHSDAVFSDNTRPIIQSTSSPQANGSAQTVYISGLNFKYSGGVFLKDVYTGEIYEMQHKAIFISSTQIQLRNVNFGYRSGKWLIKYYNDPGTNYEENSGWFSFRTE